MKHSEIMADGFGGGVRRPRPVLNNPAKKEGTRQIDFTIAKPVEERARPTRAPREIL